MKQYNLLGEEMPSSPTPYSWLFFDADDTLFDYSRAEASALSAAAEEFGLSNVPGLFPAYQGINQEIWLDFEQGKISALELRARRFARLFAKFGIQADVDTFSQRYLVHLSHGYFLFDGAPEMLSRLAGHFQMGLITNGLPEVQRPRLSGSGIADYFKFVAISEEVGTAKPDPAFFSAAMAMAGNPDKRQVLVIGDSLSSDIRGGIQAGLDTLWFNPKGEQADARWAVTYEVQSLSDILDILT
jgi:2-haloacid dehalogenase